MKILVTGGAGYIGSHFVKYIAKKGHQVAIIDDLSRGHSSLIHKDAEFFEENTKNQAAISRIVEQVQPDITVHFAAYALVAESVANPDLYFSNNVDGTQSLLNAIASTKPMPFVFSSTCAVYGVPEKLPIDENFSKNPLSPYGESKLECEQRIRNYCQSTKMPALALRYFNACGASPDGDIGEIHDPETHLIPNILKNALADTPSYIFGNDYETRDGTCIRDYIHVDDLAAAHHLGCEKLLGGDLSEFNVVNLGTGNGFSNKEIFDACSKIIGKELVYEYKDRRPGDPAELYANNQAAKDLLGFEPKYSTLENIIKTAWDWHTKNG